MKFAVLSIVCVASATRGYGVASAIGPLYRTMLSLGFLFILTAGRALAFSKTDYGSICPSGNVLAGGNSYKGLLNLCQCVSYLQPL